MYPSPRPKHQQKRQSYIFYVLLPPPVPVEKMNQSAPLSPAIGGPALLGLIPLQCISVAVFLRVLQLL